MPAGEKRGILIVIDGWGFSPEKDGNAIASALTPHYSRLLGLYPHGLLSASGLDVGLPDGVMGNSEVGHMNIGSGRRVLQDQVRIHAAISSGEFFTNPTFLAAVENAKKKGSRIHLLGLVSQGNVHSAEPHYFALLELLKRQAFPSERVFVHALLDGRDTPPRSAKGFVQNLEGQLKKTGGRIASVAGRYYTMDRDKRWERTQKGYDALVHGRGETASSASEAIEKGYVRGENDEFVLPTLIVDSKGVPLATLKSGDSVICFNFRPDRMRQIVRAFTQNEAPIPTIAKDLQLHLTSFTIYDKAFPVPAAFQPQDLSKCAGEIVSGFGWNQFRTAETEKYAHVTYFFNGGREPPFAHEERLLIPSPKVATYDLQPEMSSVAVTQAAVERMAMEKDKLIVMNFAQCDMVGHTGIFDAAVAAVEATDRALGKITEAAQDHGFSVFITADHGNIEQMVDPVTGEPHTAHTTNLVPLICVDAKLKGARVEIGGALCDVIPTVFSVLGVQQPPAMTGRNLLHLG